MSAAGQCDDAPPSVPIDGRLYGSGDTRQPDQGLPVLHPDVRN